MMRLTPLAPTPSAIDQCAELLRSAILSGEPAPEALLPPERTLAADLGVNRVTVRAALARLAQAGLLRVRQGSGYRVRDFREDGGPDLIPSLLALSPGTAQTRAAADLLLVRRHLARAVLERLAAGVEKRRLEPIRAALERFESLVADPDAAPERLAAADLAVIGAIVDASGSPVLRLCLNPIISVLASFPALRAAIYADAGNGLA